MARDSYHHGELPAALVAAARGLLATPGSEFSLREVARRAGVSNAAPYRHFDGLPALMDAVAAAALDELARALERVSAAATSAEAGLLGMAEEYLRFVTERPAEAHLAFSRPKGERTPDSPVLHAAERAFTAVVAVMERGRRDGEFVGHDPVDAALAGWSLVHGAATLVAAGQLAPVDDQGRVLADRLVAVLLSGLRTGPPPTSS